MICGLDTPIYIYPHIFTLGLINMYNLNTG